MNKGTVVLAVLTLVFLVAVLFVATRQPGILSTCGGRASTGPNGEALCLPILPPNTETIQPHHPD